MPKNEEERIGDGLVRIGAMTDKQAAGIIKMQKEGNQSLFGVIAIEMGYVDPDVLMQYLESREK